MILGADNRKKWSKQDVLVMQAYQMVQDERCTQCGLPRWLCHNKDARLQVRIKEDECWVKPELKAHEESRSKDDNFIGGTAYPEVYDRRGAPLHTFRASYYKQLAEEREDADPEDGSF
ncbi:hypothetical protein [Microbacterium sp. zg-YB36]|uniref:hypothetical protein n=1 Tax=Microbacterium sp. zg-YB36 TaxID=2969407 RepID=UPI00214C903A|nr:hypothetical protein [Microbacterium sp. zg-YB36]MDL5351102.1 hypothetical protein [Microbacterium sp. zg-YB36]